MKKIHVVVFAALFMLVMNFNLYSQFVAANREFVATLPVNNNLFTKSEVKHLRFEEVNTRAARSFVKTYKNITTENWFSFPQGGCFAEFTSDEIKYRSDYDAKGSWISTMCIYGESKLPGDIRHLVKRSYYDYAINCIYEIKTVGHDASTYVIQLENKTRLINLVVCNEEINEWQKVDKPE